MPTKKRPVSKVRIGTITIVVKDRQTHAPDVNSILSKHCHAIMARLGVNVQPYCIEHCTGMITVAVKGSAAEIRAITRDLDELYGIEAKSAIFTG